MNVKKLKHKITESYIMKNKINMGTKGINHFKELMKIIRRMEHKDSKNSMIDLNSLPLILWNAVPYISLFFIGIGYWYMVYYRELKMKYKFLCHEIKICGEKIQIIEKKKKEITIWNKENDKFEFLHLDKLKRILEKFINY